MKQPKRGVIRGKGYVHWFTWVRVNRHDLFDGSDNHPATLCGRNSAWTNSDFKYDDVTFFKPGESVDFIHCKECERLAYQLHGLNRY